MENVFDTEDKYQYYSILKIIKEQRAKFIEIKNFELDKLEPNLTKI